MKKLLEIAILVLLAALMLLPKWVTIFSILLVVIFIIKAIKEKSKFKWSWALMIMPIFYLLYLIGLINTSDFDYAGMDLGSKMSLVIFPLIFSFNPKLDLRFLFKGFILVVLASMMFGIVESIFIYVRDSTLYWRSFMGSYLGYKMHTTYLSWILNVALVILLDASIQRREFFGKRLDKILMLAFIVYIVLLKSFAGLLLLALTITIFIGYLMWKKYGKKGVASIVVLTVVFGSSICLIPSVQNEFGDGFGDLSELFEDKEAYFDKNHNDVSSTKARALLWTVAIEEIGENPLGFGTGDGKGEFVQACIDQDLEVGRKGLNPHNQYFQTTLAIGVLGGAVLLLMFLLIKNVAWKHKAVPLLFVVMSAAFHCLFESLLEKQSGIVFFTLITSILIAQDVFKKSKIEA